MQFVRMPIEMEAPEQLGYGRIRFNLAESSVTDRSIRSLGLELGDTLLCYGDHRGNPELRALIADSATGLQADDVLLTAGAASALFIIASSLLEAGDHMVVARPNYGTNIETPRAMGCAIDYLELRFADGYRLDLARLEAAIRPQTRLVSLTYPHNPTGVMISNDELRAIVEIVAAKGSTLLLDETYREMAFGDILEVGAVLGKHVVSVSSLSKTYGVPGIRLGWLACRDRALMERLLAAKEQIGICGSVVDEAIGLHVLEGRDAWKPGNDARIRRGLQTVRGWIAAEDHVEWIEPQGGCVCFPRIRNAVELDLDRFYRVLLDDYDTYVGPGHWFEQSKRHFRIGYAWPGQKELETGLANVSAAIRNSLARA